MSRFAFAFALLLLTGPAQAQDTPTNMTPGRLLDILLALDPDTRPAGNGLELTIEDVPVLVILDPLADRMRAMVSIRALDGMSEDDSRPILEAVQRHSIRPEFTCRFRWSPGTVAIWDNLSTQHYAVNDYDGSRRLLYRTTFAGSPPAARTLSSSPSETMSKPMPSRAMIPSTPRLPFALTA